MTVSVVSKEVDANGRGSFTLVHVESGIETPYGPYSVVDMAALDLLVDQRAERHEAWLARSEAVNVRQEVRVGRGRRSSAAVTDEEVSFELLTAVIDEASDGRMPVVDYHRLCGEWLALSGNDKRAVTNLSLAQIAAIDTAVRGFQTAVNNLRDLNLERGKVERPQSPSGRRNG